MEQVKNNNSQKAALIATVIILVGALLVTGCLLLTAKSRIIGIWTGGPVYLNKYSSYCSQVETFGANGEYSSIMADSSGNVVSIDVGTWEVSGFEVKASVIGETGRTVYHYNPITNKLTCGDWTYKKTA